MTRTSPRNPVPEREKRDRRPEPPKGWRFTDWAML